MLTGRYFDLTRPRLLQLLRRLQAKAAGAAELRNRLEPYNEVAFSRDYLGPALSEGWIEPTELGPPDSPTQKYRLTTKAWDLLARRKREGRRVKSEV